MFRLIEDYGGCAYRLSAEGGNYAGLIREVKNGASLEGNYVFKLTDEFDVEGRVCTTIADEELLAQKSFRR